MSSYLHVISEAKGRIIEDSPRKSQEPIGHVLPQKLIKRPPGRPPVKTNAFIPVSLPPIRSADFQVQNAPTLEEKQQRQMRSFLRNFLSETGKFQKFINLQQHEVDSGMPVTDATVQEVVITLPHLRGLNLSNCVHVTDAGLLAIARHCNPAFDTIYLAHCEQVTELGLRLLAHTCRLVYIDLSDCSQLTNTALQTLAAGCWTIETLILKRCRGISDPGLVTIAQCCKKLQHLDVAGCLHIGEYGDQALVALGTFCLHLRFLDLSGCHHVQNLGLRTLAKGCRRLRTLRLSQCQDVSSHVFGTLVQHCTQLTTLSLSNCMQLTNDNLVMLSTHCCQLTHLDLSNCPNIGTFGLRTLAQHSSFLTSLRLANCKRLDDQALAEFSSPILRKGSFEKSFQLTEAGIEHLTQSCPNLLTLNVTDCPQIRREFLHHLIAKLEFVQWSSQFIGFEPLPNAMELCRQRDYHSLERQCAMRIQVAIRRRFVRKRLKLRRIQYLKLNVVPKFQAHVRGYFVRQGIKKKKDQQLQAQAAQCIGRAYRNMKFRRRFQQIQYDRLLKRELETAVLLVQTTFRRLRERKLVKKRSDEMFKEEQRQGRILARQHMIATKVQQLYRGYRGRLDAIERRLEKKQQQVRHEREAFAATYLQCVYRGYKGRILRAQRFAEMRFQLQRHRNAVKIQQLFRGYRARQHVERLRVEVTKERRLRAAITIQRYWRSLCTKHLSAVFLGLLKLRARENEAAQSIQAAFRRHNSRELITAMNEAVAIEKRRKKATIDIQRLFRGSRGRAEVEVKRELLRFRHDIEPLIAKESHLQTVVTALNGKVEQFHIQIAADEHEEQSLKEELEKTLVIKTKYHDSSRISGTLQRYPTQFIQVQLADELQAKRAEISRQKQAIETLKTELSDQQRQLRAVRRELEPLTQGLVQKTRENRVHRLQMKVRRERQAAIRIQKLFRGFRVRAAFREGGNYWIKLDVPSESQKCFCNVVTGATRRYRPLAMDFFQDNSQKLLKKSTEAALSRQIQTSELSSQHEYDANTSLAYESNSFLSTRSRDLNSLNEKWIEYLDPETNRLYYYNEITGESKWSLSPREDMPLDLIAHITHLQESPVPYSSRDQHMRWLQESITAKEWNKVDVIVQQIYLREQSQMVRERKERVDGSVTNEVMENAALAQIESNGTLYSWVEYLDEKSGASYYYNETTGESTWKRPSDFDLNGALH